MCSQKLNNRVLSTSIIFEVVLNGQACTRPRLLQCVPRTLREGCNRCEGGAFAQVQMLLPCSPHRVHVQSCVDQPYDTRVR